MLRRRPLRALLAAAVLAAGVTACTHAEEELAAKRAAIDFHDRLGKSQFGAIYAETDFGFRHAETASQFIARMKAERYSLGGFVQTQLTGAVGEGDEKGSVVVKQEWKTEFERGKAVELLSWRVKPGSPDARLLSYRLR